MPTLPLGSVAGGNNTTPPQAWTGIVGSNLLNNQAYYANNSSIDYFDGKWFVAVTYQWPGSPNTGIYWNADPVGNPGGWAGFDPPSGTASQISLIHHNPTIGKWFIGESNNPSLWQSSTFNSGYSNVSAVYNGGSGWIPMAADNNGSKTIIGCKKKNNNDEGALFVTTDGVNYTSLTWGGSNAFGSVVDVIYAGNNVWIAGSHNYSIYYRSTDNGVTWNRFDLLGINSTTMPISIIGLGSNGTGTVICYAQATNAATGSYKLYRSTNYGSTWSAVYTYATLYDFYAVTNNPGNNHVAAYPTKTIWSPQEGCFAHMTASSMMLYSTDGATWTQNTAMTDALMKGYKVSTFGIDSSTGNVMAVAAKFDATAYSGSYIAKALAWTNNLKNA